MKLIKHGKKTVLIEYDDGSLLPLRDATIDDVQELLIGVGPLGPKARFFGFHPDTHVVYFLVDSDDRDFVIENLQAGTAAIFPNRRAIGGPGTLEMFWKNTPTKHITKLFAGAMQYIVEEDTLYITHMSVRSKWRRNRLNWLMVEDARNDTGALTIVFDDPTEMGRKFMKRYLG